MSNETFEVPLAAAEVYESQFVPAIFAEWAGLLVGATAVQPRQSVLDVACGTGIVARRVADVVGPEATVVGLDINPAMLTVAKRIRPEIEWREGDAGALPFPDAGFDVVLCQMALMFFPDRLNALAEMARVVTDDGTVGLAVPAAITEQPAYGRLVDIVTAEAGESAASLLDTYWSCGDRDELREMATAAGLGVESIQTHLGTARFGSSDDMVATEIEGSPLADRIDASAYDRIRERCRTALAEFVTAGGSLAAPLRGHILVATSTRQRPTIR